MIFNMNTGSITSGSNYDPLIDRTILVAAGETTDIGSYAFANCKSLISVSYPNAVRIGYGAFMSCFSLTAASFPVASSIGSSAFYSCLRLSNAYFPSASYVGSNAFTNCVNLTSATMPMISRINSGAFNYCVRLTSVSFPSLNDGIAPYAFTRCYQLKEVYAQSTTYIGSYAFADCSALQSLSYSLVSYIGSYAFDSANHLSTVIFNTVSQIYSRAFQFCSRLTSLYLLSTDVCTLQNSLVFQASPMGSKASYTSFIGGLHGSVYVRQSLYSSYITATNWLSYSSRIVSLTDQQIANILDHGTHESTPALNNTIIAGSVLLLNGTGTISIASTQAQELLNNISEPRCITINGVNTFELTPTISEVSNVRWYTYSATNGALIFKYNYENPASSHEITLSDITSAAAGTVYFMVRAYAL